jgi:hypothetical protein
MPLSEFGKMKSRPSTEKDLKMMKGSEKLKATAGTKIGGDKKRGGGMKLFSDFKGVGKEGTKKATKQSRKAV